MITSSTRCCEVNHWSGQQSDERCAQRSGKASGKTGRASQEQGQGKSFLVEGITGLWFQGKKGLGMCIEIRAI